MQQCYGYNAITVVIYNNVIVTIQLLLLQYKNVIKQCKYYY